MDNTLIGHIASFTLESRKTLEKEASEQLEGLYGWLPDGTFAETSFYPAVRALAEAGAIRKSLEEYSFAEEQAGIAPKESRMKLVRETAFTWLNRFVALRMMEERGLVRTVLSKLHESAGYIFWLAEDENATEYTLHEEGEFPANPAGEGPRHIAYRRFILKQCDSLAREVPVLFDTSDLPSRLFPRPVILREFIESMNSEELAEAWKKGNEETIGWVYQAFNAEEKALVKAGFQRGQKITPEGIAPFTGTYTPRWIVRKLVENSLGALWIEMHPGSGLTKILDYWVPLPEQGTRRLKAVKDILFLDPACGSMHFGLVAFDLFYEMYKEELDNAGQPGWPEKPSVVSAEDIPGAIIENNLHGIDIDLRAVQLSALALFLKARGRNAKCCFSDRNIVCANVEPIMGGSLEEFVRRSSSEHPIMGKIIESLAVKLRESESLGSLIRLEDELKRLVDEERRKAVVDRQKTFDLPDIRNGAFESDNAMDSFYDSLETELQERLEVYVRSLSKNKGTATRFAHEASKGLRLMDIVRRRYDIVATNPPYLDSRDYSNVHKVFLESEYTEGKRNLYAAFIKRCLELAGGDGSVAMITGQSFMFLSTFEEFRERLMSEAWVVMLAQHDYHLFQERIDTTAFVLRKEADEETRREREGVFFRLVKGRDGEEKRLAFEDAVRACRSGKSHPLVFMAKQADFEAVPGKPWVYWMPERFISLFKNSSLLKEIAVSAVGQNTGDNARFLRFQWEVGKTSISRDTASCEETLSSKAKWYPYMKGGKPIPWWGNQSYLINWENDALEVKAYATIRNNGRHWSRYIQNLQYCFRPGVTWSDVSSKGFAARLSPGGFIHDVTGMTCFPDKEHLFLVLGLLNSRIAKYLLAALNPTIHAQVGDIARLPVPEGRSPVIDSLVEECVELVRRDSRESEITYEFVAPPDSVASVTGRKGILSEKESAIDTEVSRLYGLSEEDLAAIDRELSDNALGQDEEDGEDGESGGEEEETETETSAGLSEDEWGRRWISYAAGIALGRFDVGVPDALGCGNFPLSVADALKEARLAVSDGILLNDPGQPLDLADRVYAILELLLGSSSADARIRSALGGGTPRELLRNWFGRFTGQGNVSFWKYHFQMYRKRPVYWPLQSPGRKFTVWLFHERLTGDTLYSLRNAIVEPRIRLAERQIEDLRAPSERDRSARQELDRIRGLADDLRAFSANLKTITDRGYTPHIDDGVLLNAAPLWTLLPSWTETKKAWQSLEGGECDWAHQAMDHWPVRVKDACRVNRSFAIAHGLEHLASSDTVSPAGAPARRRRGSR
jgi:hypothetical protein